MAQPWAALQMPAGWAALLNVPPPAAALPPPPPHPLVAAPRSRDLLQLPAGWAARLSAPLPASPLPAAPRPADPRPAAVPRRLLMPESSGALLAAPNDLLPPQCGAPQTPSSLSPTQQPQ